MYWPNPQDYNEAVQWPEYCFEDAELKKGTPELNALGLPKPVCGNFASVYKIICNNRFFAAKCFLRNVYNQHQRYAHLSQFMAVNHLDCMIEFDYRLQGVLVQEQWYPIVKMGWVEGLTLDQFLRKYMYNREQLDRLLSQFIAAAKTLKNLGIAHGDLQHGNLIVRPDKVMLVDYDGFFVPAMAGESSNELGHPNYQHPGRTAAHFDARLDEFSCWIIYHTVHFLRLDPTLWQRHSGGDDCLLFRRSDYENPANSRLLYELERHPVPEIRARAEIVRRLLAMPYERIPAFSPESIGEPRGAAIAGISQRMPPASSAAPPARPTPIAPIAPVAPAAPNASRASTTSSTSPVPPNPGALGATSSTTNNPTPIPPSTMATPNSQKLKLDQPLPAAPDSMTSRSAVEEAPPFWPAAEEYAKAIAAGNCFGDESLNSSELMKDERVRGNRGVVFKMRAGDKFFAVKCFLRHVPDRRARYEAIARHKMQSAERYFVSFQYQSKGLLVNGCWFPILKMSWVDGQTLDDYVRMQLRLENRDDAIRQVLSKFREMIEALSQSGIAHGDLEPRNILVDYRDRLKLVDYDAMYVPSLAHLRSAEVGESAYQHPGRTTAHYGPYLDNFSALLIDSILTFMTTNPPQHLWSWNVFLQQTKPANTWGQSSNDASEVMVRRIGKQIREMWKYRIDQVPALKASRSL